MSELINFHSGKLTVNTKQVADHFELNGGHRYVMSQVSKLIKETGDFGVQNYLRSSYISLQNKELDCYELTRDGFVLLAMGFTGSTALTWKIKYLNAFNAMEAELKAQAENSVMSKLNEAIAIMEKDKEIASKFGSGLNSWKRVRADHIEKIKNLTKEAQLLLKF